MSTCCSPVRSTFLTSSLHSTRSTWSTTPSSSTSSSSRCASCSPSTSSRATTFPSSACRALKALDGDEEAAKGIIELMKAVDEYIPEPERDTDKPFLMPIEDVFTITGRGTVVTGRVEQGMLKLGEEIEIVGIDEKTDKTVVTGIEMFRKMLDEAQAGDNAGILLRGTKKDEVQRGQVLAKPGSRHAAHQVPGAGVHPDQGRGRPPHAVLQQLPAAVLLPHHGRDRLRSSFPSGTEMVMPGDNTEMDGRARSSRSPWTRVCGSPSVRVAAPSAPAES